MHDYVAIAAIVRPQGRRGEVVAEILTDFPERVRPCRTIYIDDPEQGPQSFQLERARIHGGRFVLKFLGIDSISQAETLRSKNVLIPAADRVSLSPNRYYIWELKGCRVLQDQHPGPTAGAEIGTVVDVETGTGGVDLLHVAISGSHGEEILIPLADEICKRIDVLGKTILIDPPEDLLELNRRTTDSRRSRTRRNDL
jgi:16S rRNA processing protein RimM